MLFHDEILKKIPLTHKLQYLLLSLVLLIPQTDALYGIKNALICWSWYSIPLLFFYFVIAWTTCSLFVESYTVCRDINTNSSIKQ